MSVILSFTSRHRLIWRGILPPVAQKHESSRGKDALGCRRFVLHRLAILPLEHGESARVHSIVCDSFGSHLPDYNNLARTERAVVDVSWRPEIYPRCLSSSMVVFDYSPDGIRTGLLDDIRVLLSQFDLSSSSVHSHSESTRFLCSCHADIHHRIGACVPSLALRSDAPSKEVERANSSPDTRSGSVALDGADFSGTSGATGLTVGGAVQSAGHAPKSGGC